MKFAETITTCVNTTNTDEARVRLLMKNGTSLTYVLHAIQTTTVVVKALLLGFSPTTEKLYQSVDGGMI